MPHELKLLPFNTGECLMLIKRFLPWGREPHLIKFTLR